MKMPPTKPAPKKPLIDPKVASQVVAAMGEESESEFVVTSLRISKKLLARCDRAARAAAVTRSAYIKMALLEKLDHENR